MDEVIALSVYGIVAIGTCDDSLYLITIIAGVAFGRCSFG